MIPKEVKERYSCRRKSDFVTGFAITFFFLVVVWELYLIFWIPIQLRREGMLQKHIAKERMANLVDQIRCSIRHVPVKNPLNQGEIALAQEVMDLYANYIRRYQDRLNLAEILEITALLRRYAVLLPWWSAGDYAFRQDELALPEAMTFIEKNNGLRTEAGPDKKR